MGVQVTLKKQRVAKNGLVSYRFNAKRTSGIIYMDTKMFTGGSQAAPDTLVISGEGLRDVGQEEAEAAAKAAAEAAAKAAEQPAQPAQPAVEQPAAQG